jgi:hypothetical protein
MEEATGPRIERAIVPAPILENHERCSTRVLKFTTDSQDHHIRQRPVLTITEDVQRRRIGSVAFKGVALTNFHAKAIASVYETIDCSSGSRLILAADVADMHTIYIWLEPFTHFSDLQ